MGKLEWYWGATKSNGGKKEASSSSSGRGGRNTGCNIGAVFQFLNFNHFRFWMHQSPSSLHHSTALKGMEAPRNSLELDLESTRTSSRQDHHLPIPPGMQIRTTTGVDERRRSLSNDLSSPAAKTPTLVARLMGLDLFPGPDSSPTCSLHRATPPSVKSRSHRRCSSGTRSLPDTPRVSSSSSRRSIDSDRRLSLQVNANEYAKQKVKQVKENVTKRAALTDITNTSVSRNREHRRDQELLIRTKKSTTALPRLRLSENRITAKDHMNNSQTMPKEAQKGCKKMAGGDRFRSHLNKPPQTSDIMRKHKQEEPFVRPSSTLTANKANTRAHKNCKKTPLISSAVNKVPSSPATKFLLRNQSQTDAAQESRQSSSFPSCASQKYDQPTYTHVLQHHPNSAGGAAATGGAEYHYVTEILKRTGVQKDTTVSLGSWYSPPLPLDPSIFNELEFSPHHQPTNTATRKLIFHLVDEMLVEICSPHTDMKPWTTCTTVARNFGHVKSGSELVDMLCTKMQSFPAKDCRTLEDIDTIIEDDLPEWKVRDVPRLAFEEEGEGVVREIEEHVMETLVLETASMVLNIGRFGGEGYWR